MGATPARPVDGQADEPPRFERWMASGTGINNCPVRDVLDRLLGKWTILLLITLDERPHRFGELGRLVPDISRRMLSQSLRDLERDGLVTRHMLDTRPPGVEYQLTPLGASVLPSLTMLLDWAEMRHGDIHQARLRFDAKD